MYLIRCDMWMGPQMEGMKLDSRFQQKKKKEKKGTQLKKKVSHVVQYNLKYRPSAYFVANDDKSRLVHCQHHSLFFFFNAESLYLDNFNKSAGTDRNSYRYQCLQNNAGDAVVSPLASEERQLQAVVHDPSQGEGKKDSVPSAFFFPPPLSLRAPLGQGQGVPVRSGSGFAPLRAGSPPPSRERTGPPRIPLPGARRGPLPTPGRLPLSVLFFSPSPRFAEPCPGDASRLHLCLRAALSPRSPSGGAWDGKGVRASAVGEQTSAVCASGFLFLITIFFFFPQEPSDFSCPL